MRRLCSETGKALLQPKHVRGVMLPAMISRCTLLLTSPSHLPQSPLAIPRHLPYHLLLLRSQSHESASGKAL